MEATMALFRWRRTSTLALLHVGGMLVVVALAAFGVFGSGRGTAAIASTPTDVFARPTYSSPIVLSQDNKLLWVVNPDYDSVSVIRTDTNVVIKKILVGREPRGV